MDPRPSNYSNYSNGVGGLPLDVNGHVAMVSDQEQAVRSPAGKTIEANAQTINSGTGGFNQHASITDGGWRGGSHQLGDLNEENSVRGFHDLEKEEQVGNREETSDTDDGGAKLIRTLTLSNFGARPAMVEVR